SKPNGITGQLIRGHDTQHGEHRDIAIEQQPFPEHFERVLDRRARRWPGSGGGRWPYAGRLWGRRRGSPRGPARRRRHRHNGGRGRPLTRELFLHAVDLARKVVIAALPTLAAWGR